MNKLEHPIHIAGISLITSNQEAQIHNTIGNLWHDFMKFSLKDKLKDLSSPHIYAVYSDYENGDKGGYKITIGHAVNNLDNVPDELSSITIPAGNYKTYKAKSSSPEDIVETWKMIWKQDSNQLNRSFQTDFEEYSDNQVMINIGYQ